MSYLYDQLAVEWSRWLPDYALETVRKGAFYSVLVRPGLRVISVNGNYCERSNFFLMLNSTDPLGQLAWLVSELDSAEKNAERVHIINHVPPGRYDCLKTWSKNYYDIVNRYSCPSSKRTLHNKIEIQMCISIDTRRLSWHNFTATRISTSSRCSTTPRTSNAP